MLKLHAIQAAFGDCFLLESGSDNERHFVLIDGGPDDTYANHLHPAIQTLVPEGENLDLVVLSHVDNDHILGLLDMFSAKRAGENLPDIGGLWHNSFSRTIGDGNDIQARLEGLTAASNASVMANTGIAIKGVGEGAKLRQDALVLGIPINDGFPSGLIRVDDAPSPIQISDLSLHIAGPTQSNLDELKTKWQEWLDEHENGILADDPSVMANSDKSVPNLSSIMFLIKSQGKTILFTGDGRSDHLLDGLGQAGLLENGKLHVDYFKVAHHGSNRNTTKTFFKKVTADNYVISADGANDNPDFDTLTWIVEAANESGRAIKLFVTNQTPSTDRLVQEYAPTDFGYSLEIMPLNWHYKTIEIA